MAAPILTYDAPTLGMKINDKNIVVRISTPPAYIPPLTLMYTLSVNVTSANTTRTILEM